MANSNAWRHISVNDILAVAPPAYASDDDRLLSELTDIELALLAQHVDLRELDLRYAVSQGSKNGEERKKVYQLQAYLRDALAALTDAGEPSNDR